MNQTNTPIKPNIHGTATLHTIFKDVELIRKLADTAMNGTVLDKDENGQEVPASPQTIYELILEFADSALADIDDLKRQIEVLAIFSNRGHVYTVEFSELYAREGLANE